MGIGVLNNQINPLSRASGKNTTFSFNDTLATFTPAMAKRKAASQPFAAGPIVQGVFPGGKNGDILNVARGSNISGTFYQVFDPNQGTIVFWITPEWNGNDNADHAMTDDGSSIGITKNSSNQLVIADAQIGANLVTVDISSWVAGATYCVCARWDSKNPIDGTNYACISVNNVHTFGRGSSFAINNAGTRSVGCSSPGNSYAADGVISGFTIYRRVLYDGTYGVNVGNGNELTQIYNAGSGADPCSITGSWDVVFCVPTDATVGSLGTTGQAWSHPHSSNLLGTNGVDGFMTNGTAWTNWTAIGSASSPALLATAEKIYPWGYKFTAGAAGDGYKYTKTVTALSNYVLRGLAHSDGTSQPVLELWDETNGGSIGKLTGTTTSTRTAPDVFIFSGQAPTGCTSISVRCLNAAASGVTYWHQVELLTNRVANPSFANGSGTPWVPTGWNSAGLTAGESSQETTNVHSGGSSVYLNAIGFHYLNSQTATSFTVGDFVAYGGAMKSVGTARMWTQNGFNRQDGNTNTEMTSTAGSWVMKAGVLRSAGANDNIVVGSSSATNGYLDDIYAFQLSAVALTVTPATKANSTETSGLRIDGADTLVQTLTKVKASKGTIKFTWTPRDAAANVAKLGNATPVVFEAYGSANYYIIVDWSAANTLRLRYKEAAGTERSGTWDATGAIAAGTSYAMQIDYTSAQMTLTVAGTLRITISQTVNFSTALATAYFGSLQDGTLQGDGAVAA